MAPRPRHTDKDIEAFMQELESLGWTFSRGKYFKGRCACGDHIKMVHLTPSDPNYLRNLKAHIRRLDCPGRSER